MKYLSEYQLEVKNTERLERKFIMSQGQSYGALAILLNFGFSKCHPDRLVNSIYFDDIEHSSLADNVEGSPSRDKLRARYYGSLPGAVSVEIKHRRYHIGYKSVFRLEERVQTSQHLVRSVEKWCDVNLLNKVFPAAYVRYERSYFSFGKYRLTIDRNIEAGRLSNGVELISPLRNYEVIEFKYPINLDTNFREIFSHIDKFALRNTKSSKYSNALMW
ncbi:VTC domain-containing protein [Planktomarina temperata]|nr:VTC domain-containing protein [Planktomarina temperata]